MNIAAIVFDARRARMCDRHSCSESLTMRIAKKRFRALICAIVRILKKREKKERGKKKLRRSIGLQFSDCCWNCRGVTFAGSYTAARVAVCAVQVARKLDEQGVRRGGWSMSSDNTRESARRH